MHLFSIIIPTYNDEKIIKKNLKLLIKKLKTFSIKYEIIIINDGSKDKTYSEIKKITQKYNLILINNRTNQGKSFSIKKGIKKSKYENIILIDSDLPYFSKINNVINLLQKGFDFIYINRRHKKSKIIYRNLNFYKIFRYLVGYILSFILKIFMNLESGNIDTQAGLKGFKKINNFNKYKFISKKFFLDIELISLYKRKTKKMVSIPVTYKISDKSSIKLLNFKKNFEIFLELLKVIISITSVKK